MTGTLDEGASLGRWRRQALALGAIVLLGMLACMTPVSPAGADPLPVYDGSMTFPAIQTPSDPEDYSWEVELAEDQGMELVNKTTIEVFYLEDHQHAFSIFAETAHDAVGATVSTSLSIPEGDVITLTVHHRAGNPAAGGTPFVYPVTAGPGWESGFQPPVIQMPPTESELRLAQEQREREEREARRRLRASRSCLVPRLKGDSLSAARKQLRSNRCTVGTVREARRADRGRPGKVVAQSPRPGAIRKRGAAVDLTLGK